MHRLLPLAALPLLAACADDGLRVYVGDRLIYAEPRAGTAEATAAEDAPEAAGTPGAGQGWRFPTFTTNIPVYVGDRMVSPGTGSPAREEG
ncbi:hypothetical protein ruthe_01840 [Rubellimicrobium thermophilum DSM 16684]|uniref:Uncharacterized protein n=1 Tax=Rubellimicrobium thermophilum DSM 16684 TaxID=1123069 RepID=S9QYV9_9RHOB|nr:hypothetical protein [Rubellimicrobium thermophilum]EPX84843.1 hypothetical protein ruthe_01840 [Rubellimicrobium thermophilum DSM 16684]